MLLQILASEVLFLDTIVFTLILNDDNFHNFFEGGNVPIHVVDPQKLWQLQPRGHRQRLRVRKKDLYRDSVQPNTSTRSRSKTHWYSLGSRPCQNVSTDQKRKGHGGSRRPVQTIAEFQGKVKSWFKLEETIVVPNVKRSTKIFTLLIMTLSIWLQNILVLQEVYCHLMRHYQTAIAHFAGTSPFITPGLEIPTKYPERIIFFVLECLSNLITAKGSVLSMWALDPPVFVVLSRHSGLQGPII